MIKSPGHASTQVLHPIHLDNSKSKALMVLARFAGFFSAMNTAFQGQVCEHIPHLIQTSSAIEMVPPISSRVIALTGHGSTQVPQPTQSLM